MRKRQGFMPAQATELSLLNRLVAPFFIYPFFPSFVIVYNMRVKFAAGLIRNPFRKRGAIYPQYRDTRFASAVAQKLWRDRRRATRESDGLNGVVPKVALADSGNLGLNESTPLVLSLCRATRGTGLCWRQKKRRG